MIHRIKSRWPLIEILLALLALIPLVYFTQAQLSLYITNLGFELWLPDNEITRISNENGRYQPLQAGDQVLSIDGVEWSDIIKQNGSLFSSYEPGDQIQVVILRSDQTQKILWTIPAIDRFEIINQFELSAWLILPFIFWIFGVISLVLIRPHDRQRSLFSAFCIITGIWLAAGFVSSQGIGYSSEIFHFGVWINLPVCLQLSWEFPRPIKKLPDRLWWLIYLLAGLAGLLDILGYMPARAWAIVGILTILGSSLLLAIHYIQQPQLRSTIKLLIAGFIFALLPALIYNFIVISPWVYLKTPLLLFVAYWSLGLLPAFFFYAIYHRQIGQLELRANQALSIITFIIILITLAYLATYVALNIVDQYVISGNQIILISVLAGMFSAGLYPLYRDWLFRKVLGIPATNSDIFVSYSERLSTTIDTAELVELLSEQILPSLMIRQAALLQLHPADAFRVEDHLTQIFKINISDQEIPSYEQLPELLKRSGKFIPHIEDRNVPAHWAKVVLPLRIEERLIGICLLGRRDPDDYYSPKELASLQALMNLTAMALVHIDQTRLLRALLQDDINRQENERAQLALELHDQVLGQMAILAQSVGDTPEDDPFWDAYQHSVQQIREIISGLRPPLLNFGLRSALDGLGDDLLPLSDNGLVVEVLLPDSIYRYPPEVEMHIYRMLQESCLNAVQHGRASTITITGVLDEHTIDLTISDDGTGFVRDEVSSLSHLIAHQHFGLVGMHERAVLIGGRLRIESEPGQGTRVHITWSTSLEDAKPDSATIIQPNQTDLQGSESASRKDISEQVAV